jgi:DNA polymerase I-like protein with 3'-5' exonuclease and polymerase domains
MDACFFNTYNDINEIKPDLVIALGGAALYQTTGLEGITKHRGKVIISEKLGGVKVFPTFHPAAVKYDPDKYNRLKTDFENIRNALEDKPFEIVHYPYEYVDTWEQIDGMMDELRGKELNLDIETTGLDCYKDSVTLIQLSANSKKIFVIDMRTITNKPYVLSKINELMETCPVVGQDFTFDAKFLKVQYSIYPKLWEFDTCLAEYMLTGMKSNDLDYLTDKYAPESMGYSDDVKRAGGAHKVLDKKKLLQYAADDTGVMFRIKKQQRRALMKRKCMWNSFTADWCYKNLTLPCNDVLTRMSLRGLKYNTEKLKSIDEKYAKKGRRALMKAQGLDGVKACEKHFRQRFNPRSTLHIRWLMLKHYGLPVLKTTTHDNPSIGQDEMEIYAKKHNNEYCRIMEKYRSIQNIRDNFLIGVLAKLKDGVAHTNFSLHGTASGRPTSKDPNILNIPDDEDIRSCIIPRDGHAFLYSDLSQIEVREAAVIYGEPKLVEYCNTKGKDFHCMTTANMFKIPYDEVYEWYRKYEAGSKDKKAVLMHANRSAAKTITFGILYQMGPDELSYRLKITKEEAEAHRED